MISVERLPDVDAFLAAAGPFLAEREAEHNLLLGIASNLQAGLVPASSEPNDFFVCRAAGRIVLAALRTPPHNLVLSEVDDLAALTALADATTELQLPGVSGPSGPAGEFAERWAGAVGRPPRLVLAERIFRLTRVRPPAAPPGRLRLATPADRALLVDWFQAFTDEALPPGTPPFDPGLVDRRIAGGGIYLWDDDGPVAFASVGSRTPNGARVGPVYTPPDRRGRGYASACVAGASQERLDSGLRFLFLFTDLANPTANHIYEAIGYEPVRDVDIWRFETVS